MTARLLIEYDGTGFQGWALQPGRRTVQAELERALGTITRREVTLIVAGRTDSGVHAWGQVASYAGPVVPVKALNALLPPDVAVLACEPAPDGFDARRDALSRTYCYRILTRGPRSVFRVQTAWHRSRPLDLAALEACAAALPGTHDFTAFTPTDTYHRRVERNILHARWERDGELLSFWIEADTFMRSMNRVLVGTMFEVATGTRSVAEFTALLDGAPRSAAGATAPARGLALASVRY
jgi:tRNA pseudouridine38-40 synthase